MILAGDECGLGVMYEQDFGISHSEASSVKPRHIVCDRLPLFVPAIRLASHAFFTFES